MNCPGTGSYDLGTITLPSDFVQWVNLKVVVTLTAGYTSGGLFTASYSFVDTSNTNSVSGDFGAGPRFKPAPVHTANFARSRFFCFGSWESDKHVLY